MTVKQLIKKLSKLPENAEVCISNNELFMNGHYVATKVDDYTFSSQGVILIDTDYEKRV